MNNPVQQDANPDNIIQPDPVPIPNLLEPEPAPQQQPEPPDLMATLQAYIAQSTQESILNREANNLTREANNQFRDALAYLSQMHHNQVISQQQQQKGGSRSLKVKEPRTFTGRREELIPFLSELRNAITLQRGALTTDNDKALYLNAFLKKPGAPDSWWNGVEKTKPHLLENFEALLKDFTTHFQDPDLRNTKQRELDQLEQKGPASNYAARFLELCTYLTLTEETKMDYFKRGLKITVLQGLAFASPAPENLDQLITQSIRIDNNLYALELQKQKRTGVKPKTNGRQSNASPNSYTPPSNNNSSTATVPMEVDAIKHQPLTAVKRERRKKNNLCLYCGNAGHKVADCAELAKKPKKEKIASTTTPNPAPKGKGKPESD